MKNSFFNVWILSQLAKRQAGVRKVVKITNKRPIPSTPIEKWIFQLEAHVISVKNWYWLGPISFVKITHKITDNKNERRENPSATSKARRTSWIKKRLSGPTKGAKIVRIKIVDPM